MEFMTKEKLREVAPAVFTKTAHPDVSERYEYVNTAQIVSDFEKLGWGVIDAKQRKMRKGNPNFGTHMVRIAPKNQEGQVVGQSIPSLIITNSHNRTTPLKVTLGMYRLVCSNGLVVSEREYANLSRRHMGWSFKQLREELQGIMSEFERLQEKISEFSSIILTNEAKNKFAKKAIEMVYNERSNKFEVAEFLKTRREEDASDDLYTVMNVIQENIIKGGVEYITQKGHKKTRAIKNIPNEMSFNTILWAAMEQFAQRYAR